VRTTSKDYPQPQKDADNQPLLDGWQRGQLMLQRCKDCNNHFFYPRPICPNCWSAALEWHEATGNGTIVSFSLVHRPNHPSFSDEAPVVLAEVLLKEDVPILARVVNVEPATVRIGMTLALLPTAQAVRYPLPTFEPTA
jgi:uncharacterized protein